MIKKCKQYKVSTIGSKKDMIDRIILKSVKTKPKYNKNKSKHKDKVRGKRKKSATKESICDTDNILLPPLPTFEYKERKKTPRDDENNQLCSQDK